MDADLPLSSRVPGPALAAGEAGLRVFPLPAGAKNPPPTDWQSLAASEPEELARLSWPEDANIGLAAGHMADGTLFCVIDVDAGKGGEASLTALELEHGELPETYEVRTPSGGRHLYFLATRNYRNFVGRSARSPLGKGIDMRSEGGYVLAPGSTFKGKPYVQAVDADIAPMPDWLDRLCGATRDTTDSADRAAPAVQLDRELVRPRGIDYLQRAAPLAIEGQAGDSTTFTVACRLKDIGCPEDLTFELMQEFWNERCSPPWIASELRAKVANAFRYGENPPGSAAPEAAFRSADPAEVTVQSPAPAAKAADAAEPPAQPRFRVVPCHELEPDLYQAWLIPGVIGVAKLNALVASYNEGKTFTAIDIGMCIARGVPWQGRKTRQGAVLYCSAEGHLAGRVRAYLSHHQVDGRTVPFHVIEDGSLNLYGHADLMPLIDAAKAIPHLSLVVIDTLAAVTPGADENSHQDMGKVIGHVKRVREATGASVMLVHHLGKDTTKGPRGHSSFAGAADTVLVIKDQVITVEKQRDGEKGLKFGFTLKVVTIGTDSDGKPVTSCVVEPAAAPAAASPFKPLRVGSVAQLALAVVEDLTASAEPGMRRLARAAGLEEFCKRNYPDKRKAGWNAWQRALTELASLGHVRLEGDDVTIAE